MDTLHQIVDFKGIIPKSMEKYLAKRFIMQYFKTTNSYIWTSL